MQRVAIAPHQRQAETIFLSSPQNHYLHRVLRLKPGDRFIAIDGEGNAWIARLEATTATILETLELDSELSIAVTLAVALPKGNAFEEIARCCTELGVATLIPVLSDRALLNPSPKKLDRWRRILREAAEQSERQIVPTLQEPTPFNRALLESVPTPAYLCVARGDAPSLLSCLQSARETGKLREIAIATGPEGGWTPAEIDRAIACGFQPVILGKRILRAVTAPIAALSLVAALETELESTHSAINSNIVEDPF